MYTWPVEAVAHVGIRNRTRLGSDFLPRGEMAQRKFFSVIKSAKNTSLDGKILYSLSSVGDH